MQMSTIDALIVPKVITFTEFHRHWWT